MDRGAAPVVSSVENRFVALALHAKAQSLAWFRNSLNHRLAPSLDGICVSTEVVPEATTKMATDPGVMTHSGGSLPTSPTLLAKIRLRAPDAWDRFVRLYSPLVYSWCRRARLGPQDAEELGQEVFLRVALCLNQFDYDEGDGSFRGWMWRITQRKILDRNKKPPVDRAAGGDTANQMLKDIAANPAEDEDQECAAADFNILCRRALDLLEESFEPNTRRAFWLVIGGRSYNEVALELGMSVGAVYTAKSKILKRLRSEFGDLIDLPEPPGPS